MKDTAKPMKGIRIKILALLARTPDLTVADMIDSLSEFTEKQIGDNCYQAKQDGLLTSRMDGITRKQAYIITDLGKAHIKSDAASDKESSPFAPAVKPNLTAKSANATIPVSAEKFAEIEAAIDAGQAENGRLRAALKESESVREIHAKSLLDLECEKIELLRENSLLRESQSANVARIDELQNALNNSLSARNHAWQELRDIRDTISASGEESTLDEVTKIVIKNNRSEKRISDLLAVNVEIARNTLSSGDQQQVIVEQFLIRVPKRKPLVVKSFEKARQHALNAAKIVGKVEVFAMVPVGHAVRGAVWNQK